MDEASQFSLPLQAHQNQMRDLLRQFSQEMEGQIARQRYLLETLLSEQEATLRRHLERNSLRGRADAEGDGGGCSRVVTNQTNTTISTQERTLSPSLNSGEVVTAELCNSWGSISKFTAREKRLTAAAYRDAQQALGDSLGVPHFLLDKVNSAKSWHSRVSDEAKENCAETYVQSRLFQCFSNLLIVFNTMYIGIVADQDVRAAIHDAEHGTSRRAELKETLFSLDVFFTLAASLEQLSRIFALRWKFLIGSDWRWNLFDITAVLSSLLEFVFQSVEINMSFVRLVRLLRMLRSIQVVRRMTFFRKLRLMFLAIVGSILPLFWAVSALLFITFIFAVIFLQGVTPYFAEASPADSHFGVLATFYRSLPMTSLTLWMCASGGINWWELEEIWLDIAPIYAVLLISHQALMILALLNIVTGIFVHDSIEVAQNDQNLKAVSERERKVHFIRGATRIFEEMDKDHTMNVTQEQFEQQFQNPVVRHLFRTIDMDVTDAIKVFEALDVDGNRVLEIDEFVVGCAAIHGPARALDVEALKVQMRRILFKLMGVEKMLQLSMVDSTRSEWYNSIPPSSYKSGVLSRGILGDGQLLSDQLSETSVLGMRDEGLRQLGSQSGLPFRGVPDDGDGPLSSEHLSELSEPGVRDRGLPPSKIQPALCSRGIQESSVSHITL